MTLIHRLLPGSAVALLLAQAPVAAQAISAQDAAALRAQIAALKAQVDQLEARLDAAETASTQAPTAAAPANETADAAQTSVRWKGGPVFTQGDMTFHPKGRIQYDAGLLMTPEDVADRA
ncbi:MAG: hypothetical protein VX218_16940, partial [Pseudomonadota bacterium]|nr:hypothetical protein [Pseudomonadota bacterium]